MAISIHFRHISCLKPTTAKTSPAKPHDEIGALAHKMPEKARSVIFDHQDDWPLVETIVEWGYPRLRRIGSVGKSGVEGGSEAVWIFLAQLQLLEVLKRRQHDLRCKGE